jgi:hypothetical protein
MPFEKKCKKLLIAYNPIFSCDTLAGALASSNKPNDLKSKTLIQKPNPKPKP